MPTTTPLSSRSRSASRRTGAAGAASPWARPFAARFRVDWLRGMAASPCRQEADCAHQRGGHRRKGGDEDRQAAAARDGLLVGRKGAFGKVLVRVGHRRWWQYLGDTPLSVENLSGSRAIGLSAEA